MVQLNTAVIAVMALWLVTIHAAPTLPKQSRISFKQGPKKASVSHLARIPFDLPSVESRSNVIQDEHLDARGSKIAVAPKQHKTPAQHKAPAQSKTPANAASLKRPQTGVFNVDKSVSFLAKMPFELPSVESRSNVQDEDLDTSAGPSPSSAPCNRHSSSEVINERRGISDSSSCVMASQDENKVANRIGSSAYYYMVVCVSSSLCYGIALSFFYSSLRVARSRREGTSRARKFLLGLMCFMFLGNTGLFATNISYVFGLFSWARDPVTETTSSLQDRLSTAFNAGIPYHVSQGIFEILNFVIGDGLVVWRAVVLWPGYRLIQGSLWFLFLGDVGISLFFIVNSSVAVVHSKGVTAWVSADSFRILVSLGVNLLATLCIGVKAWQFRATLRLGFSTAATKKSLVNRVLTLLVECGLVFCAFQLLYAIYNLVIVPKSNNSPSTSSLNLSLAAIGPFFSSFAGIYPSLVVVVMAKQESVFGTPTFVGYDSSYATPQADQQRSGALSPMQFASVPETSRHRDSEIQSVMSSIEESSKGGVSISVLSVGEKDIHPGLGV